MSVDFVGFRALMCNILLEDVMTMTQDEKAKKLFDKVRRLAQKAAESKCKFSDALYKAQEEQPELWKIACANGGMCADADIGDWMS